MKTMPSQLLQHGMGDDWQTSKLASMGSTSLQQSEGEMCETPILLGIL